MTVSDNDNRGAPRSAVASRCRRAHGGVAAVVAALGVVISAISCLHTPVATASGVPAVLRPVACKPTASDPPIEAPAYAQDEGASGVEDGWWCQLPHATEMPASFIALRRGLVPLSDPRLYGLYQTVYAKKGTAPDVSLGPGIPSIVVAPDVDSAVDPVRVKRPPAPSGGKRVTLATGVTATVVDASGSVAVTWPYPAKGVPRYLQAVASVTVTGTDLPESTVLAVARHVEPD
jgi:hypothetical protein